MDQNNSAYPYNQYGETYQPATLDPTDTSYTWQQWPTLPTFQQTQPAHLPSPIGHQPQQQAKPSSQYPQFTQPQKHFQKPSFDAKQTGQQNFGFQQQPFGQQQQKFSNSKLYHAQKSNAKNQMSGFGGVTSGDWSMSSQHQKNGFPKKQGFGNNNQPGWKNKKPHEQKKFDITGKSPAMLLHELYKNVQEEFSEVPGLTKLFKCTLTIDGGNTFSHDANNKKLAKQKAAEVALKKLRPDLAITAIEDVVPGKKNPANPSKRTAENEDFTVDFVGENVEPAPAKKIKLSAFEASMSLLDFLRKLISESGVAYNPQFSTEAIDEPNSNGDGRKSEKQYTVTLKFAEQNTTFKRSSRINNVAKELAIKDALRELFKISEADIRAVVRRSMINKLSPDTPVVNMLYQVATLSNCDVKFDIQPAPTAEGSKKSYTNLYTASCTIIDHTDNDKETTVTSPEPQIGKFGAKNAAASEMLKKCFEIDPNVDAKKEKKFGAISLLQILLQKQKGIRNIKFEIKNDVISTGPIPTFGFDCIIEDSKRYSGLGRSKQAAKAQSAVQALKEIFNIEYNPESDYSAQIGKKPTQKGVSQLCSDISDFARREYFGMCKYYNVTPGNNLACFFLVNEKDEKRLISMASSVQHVSDPAALKNANGTAIIHIDPIVLARRSFIRYLITEIGEKDAEKSIFEPGANGLLQLKSNLRVVLFSTVPPHCGFSIEEASEKKLTYLTPTTCVPVPDTVQTIEDVEKTGLIRVNSTSDKIFKWSHVGVQGALLSTLINPIQLSAVFFGSEAPSSDASLKYALFGRFGGVADKFIVESQPGALRIRPGSCHYFTRDFAELEILDYSTGRLQKTADPSRLSKHEIYKAYQQLEGAKSAQTYNDLKKLATIYQKTKNIFYSSCEKNGLGKWQEKPAELVNFVLPKKKN